MRRVLLFLVLLMALAGVTSLSCLLTGHFLRNAARESHDEMHLWIHKQLELTPDQEKRLESPEKRFEEQRRHYSELIQLANKELAEAILSDKADSPRVRAAVDKIHEAQGELQKATLEHVFDMRDMLTPEQYDKLLEMTANALYELDRTH